MNEFYVNILGKIKSFTELVLALLLDFLLIVVIWWTKKQLFALSGLEEQKQQDVLFKWVVDLSDIGTFLVLVRHIILDILLESAKTYKQLKELKQDLKNTSLKELQQDLKRTP